MTTQDESLGFSDLDFAERLREARQAAEKTQQSLAHEMTVAGHRMLQSTIAKMESGERPVTVGEAAALAGILGVPLADMMAPRRLDSAELDRIRAHADVERKRFSLEHARRQLENSQQRYELIQRMLADAEQHLTEVLQESAR